ncbi:MAG: cell division protein FtsZ, partial [Caulobacteraceae bacterium]|nr:cell division protein FtsZ [Caulobacteraceae bacterium]
SITDLMVLPGLINLDFADVRTVMTEMGKAMMGTGEASGEDRALMAAQNAIQNPLLDEVSLKGAKAVLVNVTGGLDMTLLEVDEAANVISDQVDPEANIIFGAAFDPSLEGKIRVSVVATGMDGAAIAAIEPQRTLNTQAEPLIVPKVAAAEPQFASVAARAEPEFAPQPVAARLQLEPDLPLAPAPRIEPAIVVAESSRIAEPVAKEEEPLFPEPRYGDQHEKKGFFSMFGRPRYDNTPPLRDYRNDPTPVLQARSTAQAKAVEEAQPEAADDLEIPSFLRRLAN